jgi:hypothetical protein
MRPNSVAAKSETLNRMFFWDLRCNLQILDSQFAMYIVFLGKMTNVDRTVMEVY